MFTAGLLLSALWMKFTEVQTRRLVDGEMVSSLDSGGTEIRQCSLLVYCCLFNRCGSMMYQLSGQWMQTWLSYWTVEELESDNQHCCRLMNSRAYLWLYHYTCTCTYNMQFSISLLDIEINF